MRAATLRMRPQSTHRVITGRRRLVCPAFLCQSSELPFATFLFFMRSSPGRLTMPSTWPFLSETRGRTSSATKSAVRSNELVQAGGLALLGSTARNMACKIDFSLVAGGVDEGIGSLPILGNPDRGLHARVRTERHVHLQRKCATLKARSHSSA